MNRRRAKTLSTLATPGLIASAAISLIVHAGAALALYGSSRTEKTGAATDAPTTKINETLLTLAPEPQTPPPAPSPPPEIPPPPAEKIAAAPPPKPPEVDVFTARSADAAPAPQISETTIAAPAAESAPARATFATVEGDRAARIVYVVDASGSMTTSLPFVRDELVRSVNRLDSSQAFQVIVTRQAPGSTVPDVRIFAGGELMSTSEVNITSLIPWLAAVLPLGRSAPLAGLEAALKFEPDLIFLLSRSIRRSGVSNSGPQVEDILVRLEAMNPRRADGTRRTAIRAVQFLDDDPTGLMQAIAREHGGDGAQNAYRVLTIDDARDNQ